MSSLSGTLSGTGTGTASYESSGYDPVSTTNIVGNYLMNIFDIVGLYLLWRLWQRRHDPAIAARRPWLIALNVIWNFFYDWWWTIDNLLLPQTGGTSCGIWEAISASYYNIFIEIVLVRSFVLYALVKKTEALSSIAAKSRATDAVTTEKEIRTLKRQVSEKMFLDPSSRKQLEKITKYSSARFIRRSLLAVIIIQLIPFAIDWAIEPDILILPFGDFSGICFISVPYLFWSAWSMASSIITVVLLYRLPKYQDVNGLRKELIILAIYWFWYVAIIIGEPLVTNTYLDWFYAYQNWVFELFYYAYFLWWPVYMLEKQAKKEQADTTAQTSQAGIGNFENRTGAAGMMMDVMDDPEGFEIFREFLAGEFCSENLLFYREVEEFKSLRQLVDKFKAENSDEVSQVKDETRSKALEILQSFVSENSPFEVNISHRMRVQLQHYDFKGVEDIELTVFHAAQKEIVFLMVTGAFSRFKRTPEYAEFKSRKANNGRQSVAVNKTFGDIAL